MHAAGGNGYTAVADAASPINVLSMPCIFQVAIPLGHGSCSWCSPNCICPMHAAGGNEYMAVADAASAVHIQSLLCVIDDDVNVDAVPVLQVATDTRLWLMQQGQSSAGSCG